MNGLRAGTEKRALFAFTHDLRLTDHPGLTGAARSGSVVAVLVIDAATTARLRSSSRRAAHYCAAVAALAADLRGRGSRLIVRRGSAAPILRKLARRVGAAAVVWTAGYDAQALDADRDLQSALEEAGLRAFAVHAEPVVAPDDDAILTARGEGYRAFVPYYARWRSLPAPVRLADAAFADAAVGGADVESEALPQAAEFGSDALCPPDVSESAAGLRCARFLESPVLAYAAGRNAPALAGTSRLSADLGFGTLAARTVVQRVYERLRDPFLLTEEKIGLRLFLRAFAQRDFFLQLAWHTHALGDSPLQAKMRTFRFARTHPQLAAWRAGRTGFPIVDAGIRELHATGWMHPRVRAIAASFLCFDLGVDWRVGRDEWDRWLIEDTPALSTANWQWSAGVGADLAAYPRIYNPLKGARRFDPAALYIRHWIPELALTPDEAIYNRQVQRPQRQLSLALFGPGEYPVPVVDHDVAARRFLDRYGREVAPTSA